MTSYHRVGVSLTRPQAIKLARGERVRLGHHQIGSGVSAHGIHITTNQAKRMANAKREKRGVMLQMSQNQLRHNKLRGSGMFSNLLKSGAKALLDSGLVQKGINKVLDKAESYVGSKIGAENASALRGLADKGINKGLDFVGSKLSGSGVRRGRSKRRQTGGFLEAIPIIGPILHGLTGLGLSEAKAHAVVNRAVRRHKKMGGKLMTHVKHEAKAELMKKSGSKRRRVGGSFIL